MRTELDSIYKLHPDCPDCPPPPPPHPTPPHKKKHTHKSVAAVVLYKTIDSCYSFNHKPSARWLLLTMVFLYISSLGKCNRKVVKPQEALILFHKMCIIYINCLLKKDNHIIIYLYVLVIHCLLKQFLLWD